MAAAEQKNTHAAIIICAPWKKKIPPRGAGEKKPDRGARRKNTREAFVYITREKISTAVKIFRIDEVCKTLGAA